MLVARYRSIIVGVVLGSLALFLTYHSGNFVATDPNLIMRALKTAAFALVVPGIVAAIAMGKLEAGPFWIVAAVNFLFWFGFGWLFATFVSKLIKLRRAIAAVKP